MSLFPASLNARFTEWKLRRREGRRVVPVVRLEGTIGRTGVGRSGMTLASVNGALERAFKVKDSAAVALVINSPGGSPVQSSLIHKRIRQLADKHDRKVYVFIEDVAASGGYYIAVAGDEIYADPSSIVGSIGVVWASFGFVGLLDKLGVERRVHTAGDNKVTLDPFQPEKPEDIEHLKSIQLDVHETFKGVVRSRRGARIRLEDHEIFDGRFWTGGRALELGLIDGIGDIYSVLAEKLGGEPKLKVIAGRQNWLTRRLGRIPGLAGTSAELAALPSTISDQTVATLEDRAMWSRFGL
jgi:signal peptide peptidase SppA